MSKNNYISLALDDKQNNNGLYMITVPTGWGKSYYMFQYIFEQFIHEMPSIVKDKESNLNKIFVTTPSKKNLRFDQYKFDFVNYIEEKFSDADNLVHLQENDPILTKDQKTTFIKIFNQYSIEIKRNDEYLLDEFNKLADEISKNMIIFKMKSFHRLKKLFSIVSSEELKDSDILKSHEKDFRNDLSRYLKEVFRQENLITDKDKLRWLRNEKNEFAWILSLYPQIALSEKRIYFMSTLKFLYQIDPIIKPTFTIWDDSNLMQDSLLFMDEFDSAKADFLSFIIDVSNRPFDLIYIFNRIHKILLNTKIIDSLVNLRGFDALQDDYQYIMTNVEKLRGNYEKIHDKYHMDRNFYFDNNAFGDNNFQNFIFSGVGDSITLNTKSMKYFIDFIENNSTDYEQFKEVNKIVEDNPEKRDKEYNLIYFIKTISNLVISFIKLAKKIYWFEKKVQESIAKANDKNEIEITKEHIIHSFIQACGIKPEDRKIYDFLYNSIANETLFDEIDEKYKTDEIAKYSNDYFYNDGFSFISLRNSFYHYHNTEFEYTNFNITPETLLLNVCKKARVVSLSATNSMKTNIANFDLVYLRNNLDDMYYEYFPSLKKILYKRAKANKTWYKKNVQINFSVIDVEANDNQSEPALEDYEAKLNNIISQDKSQELREFLSITKIQMKEHYKILCIKLAIAFDAFISHRDSYSCIVFLNQYPTETGDLSLPYLEKLFKIIINQKVSPSIFETPFYVLKTLDYSSTLEKIHFDLKNKKKCFVLTTYAAAATGQNIQYNPNVSILQSFKLNDSFGYVTVEKDFDEIVLFEPTHLFPTPYGENDITLEFDENRTKNFVLNAGFKSNYLLCSAEIENNQFIDYIKGCIEKHTANNNNLIWKLTGPLKRIKNGNNYKFMILRLVDQAIGRICRTPNKNQNIYINIDRELKSTLSKVNYNPIIENEEILQLMLFCQKVEQDSMMSQQYTKMETLYNAHKKDLLNTIRKDEKAYNIYQNERMILLKSPTIKKDAYEKLGEYEKYQYIKNENMDGYSYAWSFNKESNTYSIKDISKNKCRFNNQVSEQDCFLYHLMQNVFIKRYFLNEKFAISFNEKDDYIMAPWVYRSSYKGILGEKAFEAVCETFQISFKELEPKEKELFDYLIGNTAIDVKNWIEYNSEIEANVKIIESKMHAMNVKKAIIMNVVEQDSKHEVIDLSKYLDDKDLSIVTIPYIVNRYGRFVVKNISELIKLVQSNC